MAHSFTDKTLLNYILLLKETMNIFFSFFLLEEIIPSAIIQKINILRSIRVSE